MVIGDGKIKNQHSGNEAKPAWGVRAAKKSPPGVRKIHAGVGTGWEQTSADHAA